MIDYQVKINAPEYLEPEEEEKLIEILCEIIRKDKLKVLAFNLCSDHVHFIICCHPKLLPAIVGSLKSKSARLFNIWRGYIIPAEPTGHAPLSRGETRHSLWARKFNRREIKTYRQFLNTIQYIENNRIKHQLPELPTETIERIQNVLTDYENMFDEEQL
jgi:REP element-mobilizing transposase RayT